MEQDLAGFYTEKAGMFGGCTCEGRCATLRTKLFVDFGKKLKEIGKYDHLMDSVHAV